MSINLGKCKFETDSLTLLPFSRRRFAGAAGGGGSNSWLLLSSAIIAASAVAFIYAQRSGWLVGTSKFWQYRT